MNDKLGADVKIYLHADQINTEDKSGSIKYPSEYDNINRLGKNWNVFDLELSSKYEKINHKNLISFEIDFSKLKESINFKKTNFNNVHQKINLFDLYFYFFKYYDFIFSAYDENETEIQIDKIEKIEYKKYRDEDRKYIIFNFLCNNKNIKTIKLFLNNKFKEKNIPFFIKTFNNNENLNIDSRYIMDKYKFFPIIFYDKNNEKISNLNYIYYRRPGEDLNGYYEDEEKYLFINSAYANFLYISSIDKSILLNIECSKIEMIVGVIDEINFSDVKLKNGNINTVNVETLNKYLYFNNEELDNSIYECKNDKIKVYSICNIKEFKEIKRIQSDDYKNYLKRYGSNFLLENPIIQTNILNIDNNVKFVGNDPNDKINFNINDLIHKETIISINDKNIVNGVLILKKSEILDSEKERIINIDQDVIEINVNGLNKYFYKNNDYNYNWETNSLTITFNEKINSNKLPISIKFLRRELTYKKKDLDIEASKNVHPFITLFEDDIEIQNNFYYIYNQKTGEDVTFYFKNDPDPLKNYKIQVIDYTNIYDFKLIETNYFDKHIKLKVNSIKNINDITIDINNIFFTLNVNNKPKYSIALQYCDSSNNGNLDKPTKLESDNIVIRENETYDIKLKYFYSYNGFNKFINLNEKSFYIDRSTYSEIIFDKIELPLINFNGNIYDVSNNISYDIPVLKKFNKDSFFEKKEINENEWPFSYIYNEEYFDWFGYNSDNVSIYGLMKGSAKNKVDIRLTNTDQNLSSYLVYDMSSIIEKNESYKKNIEKDTYNKRYDFDFIETFIKNSNEYGPETKRNYSIYPGIYNVDLILNNITINSIKNLNLNEINGKNNIFNNFKIVWPYINVIGKIVNKANNEIIHKNGMTITFTNNQTNEKNSFTYFSDDPDKEDLISKDYNYFEKTSSWTEYFKFLFQGFNCKSYSIKYENNNNDKTFYYKNYDSIYSEKSLKEGFYTIELFDENGELIKKYSDNFEISKNKQNELYNLEFEFPLCKFSGKLINESGKIQNSTGWKVTMKNLADDTKSKSFDFNSVKENFEFNGLGRDRHYQYNEDIYDIYNSMNVNFNKCFIPGKIYTKVYDGYSWDEQGELYGTSHYSRGLEPGTYELIVTYKNIPIKILSSQKIFNINKEDETKGLYNNIEIKIESIDTNVSGYIINDMFNQKLYSNVGITYNFTEENYDGNLEDDFQDKTKKIIYEKYNCNNNDFILENIPNLGYYKIDLKYMGLNNAGVLDENQTEDDWRMRNDVGCQITISDIKDLSGKSIFNPSGTLNSTCNLINVKNALSINNMKVLEIHIPYLYFPSYRKYNYLDEYNNPTYIPFNTCITYINHSSNDESFTVNGKEYGRITRDDYYHYKNQHSGYTGKYELIKSGKYEINFYKKDSKLGNILLYSENDILSGISYDEDNKKSYINNSFNSVTLNTNLLFYNEEKNKYELLRVFKNDRYESRVSGFYKNLLYKYADQNEYNEYYYYNNDTKLTNRNILLKDFLYVDKYKKYKSNNDEYFDYYFSYSYDTQNKNIYQCLYKDFVYKFKTFYGGFHDKNIMTFKGLYKADLSLNYFYENNNFNLFSLRFFIENYVIRKLKYLIDKKEIININSYDLGDIFFKELVKYEGSKIYNTEYDFNNQIYDETKLVNINEFLKIKIKEFDKNNLPPDLTISSFSKNLKKSLNDIISIDLINGIKELVKKAKNEAAEAEKNNINIDYNPILYYDNSNNLEYLKNEIEKKLIIKIGDKILNNVYLYEFDFKTNDLEMLNLIDKKLDFNIQKLNKNFPNVTLRYFLNNENIIDLLNINYLENDGSFDLNKLKLKNPNDIPIHYWSLIIDQFCVNIYGNIFYHDETDDENYLHSFSYFNIPLILKIYDLNMNLEITSINRGWFFFIPFIKSGYHICKIFLHNKEIYSKNHYINNYEDINFIIEGTNFTEVPVSGFITLNNGSPINSTHIVVYNNDINSLYYNASYFGDYYTSNYESKRYPIMCEKHYSFNSNENYYDYNINHDYDNLLINNGNINSYNFKYGESANGDVKEYVSLNKYGDNNKMTFDHFRLFDLIPGNYTIKYFTFPEINPNYAETTDCWGGCANTTNYKMHGDSYFYTILIDENENNNFYHKLNIKNIIENNVPFYIKKSEIRVYNDLYDENYELIKDLIKDMIPMRIYLYFNIKCNGNFYKNYDINFNETFKYNWIDLNFDFEEIEFEGEASFKITIKNVELLNSIENIFSNVDYIEENCFYGIQIYYGKLETEKIFNIERNTKTLETVNLNKMCSQILYLKINNETNRNFIKNGKFTVNMYDNKNNKITINELNFRKYDKKNRFEIYGLLPGIYHGNICVDFQNENLNIINFDNIEIKNSVTFKDVYYNLNRLNIILKDKSLNNELFKTSATVYLSNKKINKYGSGWYFDSSSKNGAEFNFVDLPNDLYDIFVKLNVNNYIDNNEFYDIYDDQNRRPYMADINVNKNSSIDVIMPYQFFKISINGRDAKADLNCNIHNEMYLELIRKTNDESFNQIYILNNNETNKYIKSGFYEIKYVSINESMDESNNKMNIIYENQYIDSNKIFTIYKNISTILSSSNNNITITLYENINGSISITENCINRKIKIYDENNNLYEILRENTDEKGTVIINSLGTLKFKFGVEDEDGISNTYELLNENNKHIKLIKNTGNIDNPFTVEKI